MSVRTGHLEPWAEVVSADLDYIGEQAQAELAEMAGRNVLITGGGGFLGYYLVQGILHWNHGRPASDQARVTVVDLFPGGPPTWLRQLEEGRALELVPHDVRSPLPEHLVRAWDFIIHAAGIASPIQYRRHPIETMDANVMGLRSLLDVSQVGSLRGFLFFSSSEIYGDPVPDAIPTPETYRGNVSCTGPRACYDESKRFGETLCVNFARTFGLPVKMARPFNNYGPGLKIADGRVIPDMARNVLEGRNVVLYSDGTATRTFCYVADAVAGYYKILVRGRAGEAYNVGVEEPEISITELAARVVDVAGDLFGYEGNVVRRTSGDPDYLTDNPNRRCPVVVKARAELGYNPSISLDEGLRRSLVWYAGQNAVPALR